MAVLLLCGASMLLVSATAQTGSTQSSGTGDQMQGPPPPPRPDRHGREMRGPERRLDRLQRELDLTPDQTEKVKGILTEGRQQMMAARDDTSASQDERREKMMKMMREQDDKIRAVLDDAQKTKFEAMEARMREKRREGRGGEVPPPPPPAPPAPPARPQN